MAAQTRTPTPNSMIIIDGDKPEQTFNSRRPTSSGKKRVLRREGSTSSLEFLPPDDKENSRISIGHRKSNSPEGANSSSRPSSRTSRAPPVGRPDSSGGRRPQTPSTPTKQVVLQAVRRKQDSEEEFGPLELQPNEFIVKKSSSDTRKKDRTVKSADRKRISGVNSIVNKPNESTNKSSGKDEKPKVEVGELENSDQFDTDLDESEESGREEEEEEAPKAPTELMLEFLDCIYKKEWNVAQNLCRMILMYEPENADAHRFQTLIEEKMKIIAERDSDEETGDEESGDDDDSDSDDDTDDSDDEDRRKHRKKKDPKRKKKSAPMTRSQDSSDADSEPEDEDKMLKKDSGIGLSPSSGNAAQQ